MSDVTLSQLQAIMPHAGQRAMLFAVPLAAAMKEFSINTPARQSAFVAQVAHESAQLSTLEESFNYTPSALIATFNNAKITRFSNDQAYRLGRTIAHKADQEAIANIAYANRMGNGSVESGEGWAHRGSGLIQLTGKENQRACAKYFGITLESIGDWLRSPEGACRSAGWFWYMNNINDLADKGDFDGVCDKVQIGRKTQAIGDAKGYYERLAFYKVSKGVLS